MRLWGTWLAGASLLLLLLCIGCTDAFTAAASLAKSPRQLLRPMRAAKQQQLLPPSHAVKQQLLRPQKAATGALCTGTACARVRKDELSDRWLYVQSTGGRALAYASTTAQPTTAWLSRLMRNAQAVMRMQHLVERIQVVLGGALVVAAVQAAASHSGHALVHHLGRLTGVQSVRRAISRSVVTLRNLLGVQCEPVGRPSAFRLPPVWREMITRLTGFLSKLRGPPSLHQTITACPPPEQAVRRATASILAALAPAVLKAELTRYHPDNWAAMPLDQQASKLRSLAAAHNLAEPAIADSISATATAVAHNIADHLLRSKDVKEFQQLFAVVDISRQLLAKTMGMENAVLEASRRYPIWKTTELLKRFLHWANSALMPLAERETRIIQLQHLFGLTTEQTKHIVEQEVLQWIGSTVQNPLQAIGAVPEEAVTHHLDQMKTLLEDDLDPKVIDQTRQMLEQLGLPVDKMFSAVEQKKETLDPTTREMYELMRSAFEGRDEVNEAE